jgi:hypothetical protein
MSPDRLSSVFPAQPKGGDVVRHIRRRDEVLSACLAAFNPRKSHCIHRSVVIQFPAAVRCDERCGIQIHGAIRIVVGLTRGCEERGLIFRFGS